MSDFRYCIRKFLEILLYCENTDSNNSSLVFASAKSPLNEFLKLGTG
ncbi:MAG: hypothetical protein HPY60_11640 [Candidatus Methanofastidiosum sp.]|nr:hypothetical protein [Methanofastidiosum sp.]